MESVDSFPRRRVHKPGAGIDWKEEEGSGMEQIEQMEQTEQTTAQAKAETDFRQYDRVWQRVLPALRPWGPQEGYEAGSADGMVPLSGPAAGAEHDAESAEKNPRREAAENLTVLTDFLAALVRLLRHSA